MKLGRQDQFNPWARWLAEMSDAVKKGAVSYFTSTADSATPTYISVSQQLAKVIGVVADESGLTREARGGVREVSAWRCPESTIGRWPLHGCIEHAQNPN